MTFHVEEGEMMKNLKRMHYLQEGKTINKQRVTYSNEEPLIRGSGPCSAIGKPGSGELAQLDISTCTSLKYTILPQQGKRFKEFELLLTPEGGQIISVTNTQEDDPYGETPTQPAPEPTPPINETPTDPTPTDPTPEPPTDETPPSEKRPFYETHPRETALISAFAGIVGLFAFNHFTSPKKSSSSKKSSSKKSPSSKTKSKK